MMRPLLAACLALAAASAAHAQQPQPATGTPDLENGRMLTYTCHGCHGVPNYKNAYPNYRVPKIGGQPEPYLVNALTYHFPAFERLMSAPPLPLVRDGKLLRRNMRREFVTEEELMGQLRAKGIDDLSQVKKAYVESEGELTFVTREEAR